MITLLPPAVTLDLRATSLGQALPLLGKAFGTPMRAAPAIGEEIVIASLKGADLPDFRARLAALFAGEWSVDRDGTLVFGLDARARAKEARDSAGHRTEMLGRGIAGMRTMLARNAPISAESFAKLLADQKARYERNGGRWTDPPADEPTFDPPERRLHERLVSLLRLADLGAIGERTVFSTRPTARQRTFPGDVGPILATYAQERRTYVALGSGDEPVGEPVALITLAIENRQPSLSGALTAYDGGGHPLFARSLDISADDGEVSEFFVDVSGASSATAAMAVSAMSEPPTPPGERTKIEFSPETLAFVRTLGSGSTWFPRERPRPDLAEYRPFLDPVARDPLSYAASDVALSLAKGTGRSVLVRGFDGLIACGDVENLREPVTAEEAFGTKAVDRSHAGWLTAEAEDPYEAGLVAFPRPALRDALRIAFAAPWYPLDAQRRIAALIPEVSVRWIPLVPLVSRFAREEGVGMPYDLRALRLWNALGSAAPKGSGEFVARLADLNPPASAKVQSLIFGTSGVPPRREDEQPLGLYASEPTNLLPRGLSPDGRLAARQEEKTAFRVRETGRGAWRSVTAEGLAELVFEAQRAGSAAEPNVPRYDLERIGVVANTVATIEFALAPDITARVASSAIAPTGATVTLQTLPAESRERYEKRMRELASHPKEPGTNEFGGPGVPPPS